MCDGLHSRAFHFSSQLGMAVLWRLQRLTGIRFSIGKWWSGLMPMSLAVKLLGRSSPTAPVQGYFESKASPRVGISRTPCLSPLIWNDCQESPTERIVQVEPGSVLTRPPYNAPRISLRAPVDWLWKTEIPLGEYSVLVGHPSSGKSTFAAALAAHVSAGIPFPDGTKPAVGDVLFPIGGRVGSESACSAATRRGAALGQGFQ